MAVLDTFENDAGERNNYAIRRFGTVSDYVTIT